MHLPSGMSDPRLSRVDWRDLKSLTRPQIAIELLWPIPWLGLSFLFFELGLLPLALICSFYFFLAGLRLVHDAYHYNLGIGNGRTEGVMFLLSIAMLGSMHAVQHNHLQHHRHCLDEHDVEARSAHMRWWQALLFGPIFPIQLHVTALRHATRKRTRWVLAELIAIAALCAATLFAFDLAVLTYHLAAMLVGQCLTAFFAVWTVHHDSERPLFARTMRNRAKSVLAFDMFFHVEHHLFPAVPTRNLPELARRVDSVAPEYSKLQVY